jgi:hypothetical protein
MIKPRMASGLGERPNPTARSINEPSYRRILVTA